MFASKVKRAGFFRNRFYFPLNGERDLKNIIDKFKRDGEKIDEIYVLGVGAHGNYKRHCENG